eukprot:369023-Pleurochrysis_carterae.AAC.1
MRKGKYIHTLSISGHTIDRVYIWRKGEINAERAQRITELSAVLRLITHLKNKYITTSDG